MRKLLLFSVLLTAISFVQAQTCCTSQVNDFSAFSNDLAFVNTHEEPLPFVLHGGEGEMITYKTDDDKTAMAYMIKAHKKSDKYLIVYHEWWGLNDYIKQMAEKLHGDFEDVNIIAPDLYDGKITTTRDEAANLTKTLDEARVRMIIDGALDMAGKKADIATIGWCMGGGWSLQTAIMAGDRAKGAVVYYGMPEQDMEKLKTLQAPVLFIHATQDKFINSQLVDQFEANMRELGKNVRVERYDADHAFANPSNPKHNEEFANNAYNKSVSFIRAVLE